MCWLTAKMGNQTGVVTQDSGTEQVSGEYAAGSLTSNPVPEGGYTWIFGVEDEEGDYRYETGGVTIG